MDADRLELEAAQGENAEANLGLTRGDRQAPKRRETASAIEGEAIDFIEQVQAFAQLETGDR